MILKCHCKECEDGNEKMRDQHYHLVKDYHPDIPWKDSKHAEKELFKNMVKTWGYEHAKERWDKGVRE